MQSSTSRLPSIWFSPIKKRANIFFGNMLIRNYSFDFFFVMFWCPKSGDWKTTAWLSRDNDQIAQRRFDEKNTQKKSRNNNLHIYLDRISPPCCCPGEWIELSKTSCSKISLQSAINRGEKQNSLYTSLFFLFSVSFLFFSLANLNKITFKIAIKKILRHLWSFCFFIFFHAR
jgi:hypothetical protein